MGKPSSVLLPSLPQALIQTDNNGLYIGMSESLCGSLNMEACKRGKVSWNWLKKLDADIIHEILVWNDNLVIRAERAIHILDQGSGEYLHKFENSCGSLCTKYCGKTKICSKEQAINIWDNNTLITLRAGGFVHILDIRVPEKYNLSSQIQWPKGYSTIGNLIVPKVRGSLAEKLRLENKIITTNGILPMFEAQNQLNKTVSKDKVLQEIAKTNKHEYNIEDIFRIQNSILAIGSNGEVTQHDLRNKKEFLLRNNDAVDISWFLESGPVKFSENKFRVTDGRGTVKQCSFDSEGNIKIHKFMQALSANQYGNTAVARNQFVFFITDSDEVVEFCTTKERSRNLFPLDYSQNSCDSHILLAPGPDYLVTSGMDSIVRWWGTTSHASQFFDEL